MSADIRAGRAFVEVYVNNKAMVAGLAVSRRMLRDFALFADTIRQAPVKLLKGVGAGMTALGKAQLIQSGVIAASFVPVIKAASDAKETLNKFRAVFTDQAAGMLTWVNRLTDRVGRSRIAVQESLSAYQAFFKGLAFGSSEAAGMSREMQSLTIDFGSFFNVTDSEAARRMLSGLSGSSEVFDQFGINLKQAALVAELSAMGIDKAWSQVTEPEKVLARMNLIRKAMGAQGAIGDAERTSGAFANLWKKITGSIRDAAAAVGSALLPVLEPLAARVAEVIKQFADWARANGALIRRVAQLALRLAAVGAGFMLVGKALSVLGSFVGFALFLSKWGLILRYLVPMLPMLFAITKALGLTSLAFTTVGVAVKGLGLGLAYVLPLLIKVTLAVGVFALGLGALALAYVNAKIKGISFGESILDLTHKITGQANAYTRLRDAQRKSEARRLAEGGAAYNMRFAAGPGGRDFEAERKANEAVLADNERKTKLQQERLERARELVSMKKGPGRGEAWSPKDIKDVGEIIGDDRRRGQFEGYVDALERQISNSKSRLAELRNRAKDVVNVLAEIDQSKKDAAWESKFGMEGMAEMGARERQGISEMMAHSDALERARLEGAEGSQQRELDLLNQEYDIKIREVRRAAGGGDTRMPEDRLNQLREQELLNIRNRYARDAADNQTRIDRDAADTRLRQETQLQRDIERLKITSSKRGRDRELALLRMEERHALQDADQQNAALIRDKYALLRGAAGGMQRMMATRGTFSATALSGMGYGNPAERTAKAAEQMLAQQKATLAIDQQILTEQKRLTLEATA